MEKPYVRLPRQFIGSIRIKKPYVQKQISNKNKSDKIAYKEKIIVFLLS